MICKTKIELATVLNVRQATVTDWSRKGMPTRADGTYDSEAVAEWNRQRKANMVRGGRAASGGADPDYWLAKKREREAQKLELDLRRIQGELVEKSWVAEQFANRILEFRQALSALTQSLPPELVVGVAPEVAGRLVHQIRARLEREFQELMDGYARALPEAPMPGAVVVEEADEPEESDA